MTDAERARFDSLVEEFLGELPPRVRALLDEVPLIVDDIPEPRLAEELYAELGHPRGETIQEFVEGLCGLHTGVPLTERSVEHSGVSPEDMTARPPPLEYDDTIEEIRGVTADDPPAIFSTRVSVGYEPGNTQVAFELTARKRQIQNKNICGRGVVITPQSPGRGDRARVRRTIRVKNPQ